MVVEEWGCDLIGSWNKNDWVAMTQRIGGKLARLIGAQEHEVLACDTTSINLFKALCSCLQLRPGRSVIVSGTPGRRMFSLCFCMLSAAPLLGAEGPRSVAARFGAYMSKAAMLGAPFPRAAGRQVTVVQLHALCHSIP